MHAVILGNGVTGYTAALRLRERQPDWRITMISGESTHPWSRPALMYVYMGHMRYQDTKPFEDSMWAKKRIELVRGWVTGIDVQAKQLRLHGGQSVGYDKLLLALGARSNKFGWPGQDLDGVQGMYSLMDLKALYDHTRDARRAVIVGGGLIGIELAEMLHSRHIEVTFLVREASYWNNVLPAGESAMVNRVIRAAGFDLRLDTELSEIVDDGTGQACGVVIGDGERIECQLVGLTAGVSPNVDLLEGTPVETGRGVLVDWSLHTSVPDVWAAGDCAEIQSDSGGRNLLQQVWYTGKLQGRVAADSMAGDEVRYDPGTWYNSAKFLDLEYQTYGDVNRKVPGERSLYWEHAGGLRSMRITYLPDEAERVIGFNFMGVRERHRVCERWIEERRPLGQVLDHLPEAGFDPELVRHFEREAAEGLRSAAR